MANVRFTAAADAFVNGGILVPEFQSEIKDIARRGGVLGQRINYVPATGSPSRFFEQDNIQKGKFNDKQNLTPSQDANLVDQGRRERSVTMKALTGRITYGLFDTETVMQQNNFAYLKAKDLKDMLTGIVVTHDDSLWNGQDVVNGAQVGNGGLEYVGLLNQIVTPATAVASGNSIVDAIRLDVAKMMANKQVKVRPTAVYVNPMTAFLIEQENKQANNTVGKAEVIAGMLVDTIMTSAGPLPIVVDPFLGDNTIGGTSPASGTNYGWVIVDESMIEYHYVGSATPRLFQLGTVESLVEDYVGVMFGAPVLKHAAHVARAGFINTSL